MPSVYIVCHPRALRTVLTLLLTAVLALFVTSRPLHAQQLMPVDPQAPVSNTGVVPNAGPTRAQLTVSLPSTGTGALVTSTAGITSGPEVAPARIPGQGASPNSIIGPDGRYQITNTTTFPYRAIAHVTSSIGGCTGWLIGVNTVATAGHCVHTGGTGGTWATNVMVYPGRNGSSTPYGSCTARVLYSVLGWVTNGNRDYDYGAIKLNCSVGTSTGYFGFHWQSASLTGQPTSIAGYPGDKAYGTMWRSDDQVRITQTYRLYYANDTAPGESGAPVWNSLACNTCGIAIHAYGVDSTGYNGGTRITQSVFNNLLTWRNS